MAEAIGLGGPRPIHFLAPVSCSYIWPSNFQVPFKTSYYIVVVLHSHSDILTSTGVGNGIVGCGLVCIICVDRPYVHDLSTGVYSPKIFTRSTHKLPSIVICPWFCLTKPTVCLTHPLFRCFRHLCHLRKIDVYWRAFSHAVQRTDGLSCVMSDRVCSFESLEDYRVGTCMQIWCICIRLNSCSLQR